MTKLPIKKLLFILLLSFQAQSGTNVGNLITSFIKKINPNYNAEYEFIENYRKAIQTDCDKKNTCTITMEEAKNAIKNAKKFAALKKLCQANTSLRNSKGKLCSEATNKKFVNRILPLAGFCSVVDKDFKDSNCAKTLPKDWNKQPLSNFTLSAFSILDTIDTSTPGYKKLRDTFLKEFKKSGSKNINNSDYRNEVCLWNKDPEVKKDPDVQKFLKDGAPCPTELTPMEQDTMKQVGGVEIVADKKDSSESETALDSSLSMTRRNALKGNSSETNLSTGTSEGALETKSTNLAKKDSTPKKLVFTPGLNAKPLQSTSLLQNPTTQLTDEQKKVVQDYIQGKGTPTKDSPMLAIEDDPSKKEVKILDQGESSSSIGDSLKTDSQSMTRRQSFVAKSNPLEEISSKVTSKDDLGNESHKKTNLAQEDLKQAIQESNQATQESNPIASSIEKENNGSSEKSWSKLNSYEKLNMTSQERAELRKKHAEQNQDTTEKIK